LNRHQSLTAPKRQSQRTDTVRCPAASFRDFYGLNNLHEVWLDNAIFEVDYLHAEALARKCSPGSAREICKVSRGNAIRTLHLNKDQDR
jgi:hypothetical protein